MEAVREWIARYRQVFILLGVFGMMLAPFLWPFFLAIIFQAFCVAVPFLIVGIAIKILRREKPNEQRKNQEYPHTEHVEAYAGKEVSNGTDSKGKNAAQTDPLQKRSKEVGAEPLNRNRKGNRGMSDDACIALMWYQLEGRERIFRLMRKLEREGNLSFSVSPEGICSVREKDRFRRVGALRSYPCKETKILMQELQKDHIRTMQKGRYLWLSWRKGELR